MILYKLYRVEITKDVPMLTYITQVNARNIIDAEDVFDQNMYPGFEYLILQSK